MPDLAATAFDSVKPQCFPTLKKVLQRPSLKDLNIFYLKDKTLIYYKNRVTNRRAFSMQSEYRAYEFEGLNRR